MTSAQLDRLGERLKGGNLSKSDLITLATFRNEFISSTNIVAARLASAIRAFKADITQRPAKSTPSIIAKLQRESVRLTQIQDIGGVRVVVSKVSVQDRVVVMLRDMYRDARIIDRRVRPQHGYRAVHVVVIESGHYVEIQVRTRMQNEWAQLSEKLADVHDQTIKYGGGPKPILDELRYLTQYCATVEQREVVLDEYKRAGKCAKPRKACRSHGRLRPGPPKKLSATVDRKPK